MTTEKALRQVLVEFFESQHGMVVDVLFDGWNYKRKQEFLPAGVLCTLEDSYGGEGQGEEYWKVYKFQQDSTDVYVRFYGSWMSHEGSEYAGYEFVQPLQKTITVYQ